MGITIRYTNEKTCDDHVTTSSSTIIFSLLYTSHKLLFCRSADWSVVVIYIQNSHKVRICLRMWQRTEDENINSNETIHQAEKKVLSPK